MATVTMTAHDWRNLANEAVESAVCLAMLNPRELGRDGRLERAAALLRAADTFNGRANLLDLSGFSDAVEGIDEAIEVIAQGGMNDSH